MAKIESGAASKSRAYIKDGCLITMTPLPSGTLRTAKSGKSQLLVVESVPAEFTIGGASVRVNVLATVKTQDVITLE